MDLNTNFNPLSEMCSKFLPNSISSKMKSDSQQFSFPKTNPLSEKIVFKFSEPIAIKIEKDESPNPEPSAFLQETTTISRLKILRATFKEQENHDSISKVT